MPTTFQQRERHEPLITVEEAQRRVIGLVGRLSEETVPLEQAGGRVLAADVAASRDVPAHDNSAMDGYAVLASDVATAAPESPVTLRVVDDIPAGRFSSTTITSGTAARIMTGAPAPEGADAVVQVELTDAGTATVTINAPVARGANIRRRGEDLRSGMVAIAAGTLLRAGEIGVLATLQHRHVHVAARPRVAILATGSELLGLDEALDRAGVVNSNSYSLAELVRECGGVPYVAPIIPDEAAATRRAIEGALAHDVVVTTGGVSAGAYDFVKDALDDLGAQPHVSKIAMKPGKPVVVSTLRDRIVFGLPGNPVSCMVAFTLFVAPALRRMGGRSDIFPPLVRTRLTEAVSAKGDRRVYQRVRVEAQSGELVSAPMRAQGSGVSSSMLGANGFVITEPGSAYEAGEMIDTLLIGEVALGKGA